MGIEAVALLEVLNWKHIGGGGTGGAGAATAKASSPQYKTPACSLACGAEEMALPQVSLQSRAQLSSPCVLGSTHTFWPGLAPAATCGIPRKQKFRRILCSSSPSGVPRGSGAALIAVMQDKVLECSDSELGRACGSCMCLMSQKGKKMISHGMFTAGAISTSAEHPTEWQFEGVY